VDGTGCYNHQAVIRETLQGLTCTCTVKNTVELIWTRPNYQQKQQLLLNGETGITQLVVDLYGDNVRNVGGDGNSAQFYVYNKQNGLWQQQYSSIIKLNVIVQVITDVVDPYVAELLEQMHEAPDDSDSVKAPLKAVRSVRTSLQTNRQLQAILQLLYQGLRDQSLAEKFNSDPYLLSVTEGVIDLRTGVLRARVKQDYQTYAVAIEFNLRDERLEELTGIMKDITLSGRLNRPEYLQYLQRVIGYCITGHSKEEIMIFLKGQGSNGKGIVESMLQGILGVLFYQAPKEVIIAAKSGSAGGASSHLMALKNKRVAYFDEIPRDKLDDNAITTLTALCNYNHFRRCRIPPLAAVKKAEMHTAMNAKGYHKQQCRLSVFEFRDKQVYTGLSLLNM
jgi:hypothetical protein